ncbi:cytochrome P450, partial [Streptomyces sp. NPDC055078]
RAPPPRRRAAFTMSSPTAPAQAPVPSLDIDLFSDENLTDPYPAYARLRALGPVVRLPRVAGGVWAVSRYADVKAVLHDPGTYSSVEGIALTDLTNKQVLAGTVLASDGPAHARLRRPLSRQLKPAAITTLRKEVEHRADRLVRDHITRGGEVIDSVSLARDAVAGTVLRLIGMPPEDNQELLDGATAIFDVVGPENERYARAAPHAAAVFEFLHTRATRERVRRDSWMGALYEAVDEGLIDESDAVPLMTAYTAAGLDTTIQGLAETIRLCAAHPRELAHLRTGRARPVDAFHETLRLHSPVQGFGRRVNRPATLGGATLAEGDRVWLLYGATGRCRDTWGPDADEFKTLRPDLGDHLALGSGPHTCAGRHITELQATALIGALVRRCKSLRPAGTPVRVLNNTLRGWQSIPIAIERDRRRTW